jgi:AcrR family transcriptional regulator
MARTSKAPTPKNRTGYHHGNLKAAMIEATVALIEERGEERVTVREAARRAGVSSGAPFRHFASRKALMTAVAEEGMRRLRAGLERAFEGHAEASPLIGLLAMADGYITWAVEHPTYYRILGDRPLIDFYESDALVCDNRWIRDQMLALFTAARKEGLLRPCDIRIVTLQTRAMAYGLARMHVDGHFREFGIAAGDAKSAMIEALRAFIFGLATEQARKRLGQAAKSGAADG